MIQKYKFDPEAIRNSIRLKRKLTGYTLGDDYSYAECCFYTWLESKSISHMIIGLSKYKNYLINYFLTEFNKIDKTITREEVTNYIEELRET